MRKRIGYFDFLRVLAVTWVVGVHVAILAVNHYGEVPFTSWCFGMFMEFFARSSVSIFVMIAGALALQSRSADNIGHYVKRKITRILYPSLFYIAVYGWWSIYTHQVADIKTLLIKTFVYGVPYNHLYFIFVIAGLYLFTPFLRRLVLNLNFREYTVLLAFVITLTAVWDFSAAWFTRNWTTAYLFSTSFFVPFIGYYLAGHYFDHFKFPGVKSIWLATIFVVSSLLIAVIEYYLIDVYGINARGLIAHNYQGLLVVMQSLSLFVMAKRHFPNRVHPLVLSFAKASFGIYLVHQIIVDILLRIFSISINALNIGQMSLLFVLTVLISYLITVGLSKLPMATHVSGMES